MPKNLPQLGCVFALATIAVAAEQSQPEPNAAEQRGDEIHTLTILGSREAVV